MREGRGSGRCNQKHYRSKFNYVCSRNKSTRWFCIGFGVWGRFVTKMHFKFVCYDNYKALLVICE
jgi:hypothetical protein